MVISRRWVIARARQTADSVLRGAAFIDPDVAVGARCLCRCAATPVAVGWKGGHPSFSGRRLREHVAGRSSHPRTKDDK